jgi:hypothetical protein
MRFLVVLAKRLSNVTKVRLCLMLGSSIGMALLSLSPKTNRPTDEVTVRFRKPPCTDTVRFYLLPEDGYNEVDESQEFFSTG